MTDQELLELSAKAAGYKYAKNGGYIVVDGIPGNWNPLSDDGDALRLAVKLEMQIVVGYRRIEVCAVPDEEGPVPCAFEPKIGDLCAATRRAIVRAAAEIGRGMK